MPLTRPHCFRLFASLACLAASLAITGCGQAAEPASPATSTDGPTIPGPGDPALGEKWCRVLRNAKGKPLAMQTAIVRYVPEADFVPGEAANRYIKYVDLVGAVHIADHKYYEQLNRRFEGYDAVLYELVAPEGTIVPKGRGTSNSHPLGALQNGMKTVLELEHQLEQIDYTRPNFVHADLSPDEFLEKMKDRNEGFVEMYFRLLGASVAAQSQQAAAGESADLDFVSILFAKDRARQLKIAMAKQFEGMESLMVGLAGPDGSTLITERNTRALDVLEKELAAGKSRLAIFYGAGHLAPMHKEMLSRFHMHPVSVEWLQAWDLREK